MTKIVAIVLLAAGILALIYGGFTYTKETQKAKIGSVQINVIEDKRVNVPVWAGLAMAILGGGLLIGEKRLASARRG